MASRLLLALLGALAFALSCEILLRVLPVSTATNTGYYVDSMILTYPAHHEWQVATGWDLRNARRLRSNNFGFAADRDFQRDPTAVAFIGDSFVEASMLSASDRPGSQLERALGGRRAVFAMGGPGSSLLDYAERIRFANQRFGIEDFVLLLEQGDIRQSLCGSGNVHAACLDPDTLAPKTEKQAPPSLAKRLLRQSAFAQYVFSQLKVTPHGLWRQAFSTTNSAVHAQAKGQGHEPPSSVGASARIVDAVALEFFTRVQPYWRGRLVLIMDCDRASLRSRTSTPDPDRSRFMALAAKAGAIVIDAERIFARQLDTSPLRLEVGPYDAHLNALAVRLIADSAAASLSFDITQP